MGRDIQTQITTAISYTTMSAFHIKMMLMYNLITEAKGRAGKYEVIYHTYQNTFFILIEFNIIILLDILS